MKQARPTAHNPQILAYGQARIGGKSTGPGGAATQWLAYGSLLMLALAAFAPTLGHQFVWDDLEQVRDNDYIRHWSSFWDFWQKDILALSRKGGIFHANYYRPLFYVQYLLYYQAFGLNSVAWHGMAIVQHFFASAAALLFLRRMGFSLAVAWTAAALFVVHPAHGESVSWVAAAFNDPPAATLLLLGLTAHATWVLRRRVAMLGLAVLAYAGALCMKESALSMLLLAPLVEWYLAPRYGMETHDTSMRHGWAGATARSTLSSISIGIWPYGLVTVAYFFVRKTMLGSAFGHYEGTRSIAELAPTMPMLAMFYLRLALWPFGLSPSYGLRYVPGWGSAWAWGGLLGGACVVAIVWVLTRGRRELRFAALWMACCVWPVFNIRSFRPEYLAHQRYLYLASLSVCIAVGWLMQRYVAGAATRIGAVIAIIVVWLASDLSYDRAWATDHNLWTRIGEVDPHNCAAFDWLGNEARENGDMAAAERLYQRSIEANPKSPYGYWNRAVMRQKDRPEEAIPLYEQALAAFGAQPSPDPFDVLKTRSNYGALLMRVGRVDEGLRESIAAARTPPYSADAACNAALVLTQRGRAGEAEAMLLEAVEHLPNERAVYVCLMQFYKKVNRAGEAERWAAEYARRFPSAVGRR